MNQVSRIVFRGFALAFLVGCLLPSAGCRICADCDDMDYPAYGGAWQRTRRDGGRVGSLFDPAGARTAELVDRDEPASPNELERQRQKGNSPLDPDQGSESESQSPSTDDPDANMNPEPSDADDAESLKLRKKELEDLKLEDIKTVPQRRAPRTLR